MHACKYYSFSVLLLGVKYNMHQDRTLDAIKGPTVLRCPPQGASEVAGALREHVSGDLASTATVDVCKVWDIMLQLVTCLEDQLPRRVTFRLQVHSFLN